MSHRALLGLLVVSVAINLLMMGLIGGHLVRGDRQHPAPLAWAFKDVPPEVRQKVRPLLREHMREVITARRDVGQAERRLRRLLKSETLARDELQAGLVEMRASSGRYHEVIHEAGLDVLMSLTPDERIKAAPYLFKMAGPQARGMKKGTNNGRGKGPNEPRSGGGDRAQRLDSDMSSLINAAGDAGAPGTRTAPADKVDPE